MRGTALVVLLCLAAAFAAHTLSEEARARTIAADELCQPGEPDGADADDVAACPQDAADAPAADRTVASKHDAALPESDVVLIAP